MARVLTGIQSTGIPHLGNILGAIMPAIKMANNPINDSFLFIADLHSLTTVRDANILKENTYSVAAAWLAFGLDVEKTVFYRQSDVPEVCELTWYLSCFVPYPMLANAHSFKDKSGRLADVNAGLFIYPVLMAADIILYDVNYVPVGKDQQQHLEIARDIANVFNKKFGETFVIPKAVINNTIYDNPYGMMVNMDAIDQDMPVKQPEIIKAIMDIVDQDLLVPGTDGKKMSKSYNNTINIFLPDKELRKVIMKIVTDTTPIDQPKNPDTCTIFKLYSLLASPEEIILMRENYARPGYGYGDAKQALLFTIEKKFKTERLMYNYYINNKDELDKKLKIGEKKARDVAKITLKKVREKLGYLNKTEE